jgi:hypothetical protein
MAAEQIPPTGGRCDAPWATLRGRHRPLSPDPPLQSHTEPATRRRADGDAGEADSDGRAQAGARGARWRSGAKCEIRAKTLWSGARAGKRGAGRQGRQQGRDGRGSGRKGTAGGSGGARNRISMQRPYGAGRGPAGPAWSDSDRTATAGGCGGARNAISRSDPMHWGAGQWGAGHWGAGQWEAGRKGRVQTGGGGWRLWPGTECEIRAKTLWSGSRRRGPGWPAFGRAARSTSHFGPSGCHIVMAVPGLVPGISSGHPSRHRAAGMAGTSPAMTLKGRTARPKRELLPTTHSHCFLS